MGRTITTLDGEEWNLDDFDILRLVELKGGVELRGVIGNNYHHKVLYRFTDIWEAYDFMDSLDDVGNFEEE